MKLTTLLFATAALTLPPTFAAAETTPITTAAPAPESTNADMALAGAGELIDAIVIRGEKIERALPDELGARLFAGKKTTNINLDEAPPLSTGQLREAFALIPGLLVSEVSNRSWASVSYRGLGEPHESWNTLIMKDGIAVSPDPYNYPAAYYTPPLDAITRIEFVRGGASLLYGPQPGGALNYVTRKPGLDENGFAGAVVVGDRAFSNVYLSGRGGNGQQSLYGYVSRVSGDGARRDNADFLTESANINAAADLGGWLWTASLDAYRGRFGEPGGLSATRFQADPEASSTPQDRVAIDRVVAALHTEGAVGDWTVFGRLNFNYYDRASRRQTGGSFGDVTPAANVALVQSQKFRNATLDVRARTAFDAFGAEAITTVGATLFASRAPVTVDKGNSPTDWEGLAGPIARTQRQSTVGALFGEVAFDAGAWTITPGLRVENLRQSVRETLELSTGSATGGPPGAPIGALDARTNAEWIVLPGLGVSYDITPEHEAYANISRGFKPLLFNDGLTFQSGVNAAGVFESGYAWTSEAGVRGAFGSVLSYDVSAFFIRLENQVGFLAGPLAASPPFGAVGVGGARRQTVGTMENKGIDLAGEVSLAGLFNWDNGFDALIFANASLLDAEFVDGAARGFTPQYAPEFMGRAGVIARFGEAGKVSFSGTYTGEHNGSDNASPTFRIPAFAVFDLTGEWQISPTVSLFGAVNNVFDRTYIARIRPGGGQGIDPGAPRTASVGLRLSY